MCISRGFNNVTSYASRHNLCHNVFVGKANNKTILRCVVLVLVLIDQTDPCPVISLTICTISKTTLRIKTKRDQKTKSNLRIK